MDTGHIRSIVIVGGGTAGWMAASLLSRFLERRGVSITVVESEAIGTVGVGEATVPTMRLFNGLLGFSEPDFIQATQASFKLGIEFVEWGGPNTSYFHGFGDYGEDIEGIAPHQHWLKLHRLGDRTPIGEHSFPTVAAKLGRFAPPPENPQSSAPYYQYAYHFDANLYARYLRAYAEKRGVMRCEGVVSTVAKNGESGRIESVSLKDGRCVEADFFVDCSGFASLLLEGALETPYLDWRRWLPCDRAVAAPCASNGDMTPHTKAIAQMAGWRWRIPLQHRVGNGYVYCSKYCSDDQAEAALRGALEGELLAEPRVLRFTTGRRKVFWNKNCVGVGLAAGFMEPLESTSIQLIQSALTRLIEYFPDRAFDQRMIDEYNRLTANEFERIRDFLILHYCLAARDDSDFWRACRSIELPDTLAHKIDVFKSCGRVPLLSEESYAEPSWVAIFLGNGVLPRRYDPLVDRIDETKLAQGMAARRHAIHRYAEAMPDHASFIARTCAAAA